MGFFDIFKSRKKEQETEIIVFSDIYNWLNNKKEIIEKQKNKFIIDINHRINQVADELERKILILEKVSLDNKKVEEKLKLIVEENLQIYLSQLRKFISNLNYFHERNLEPNKMINEIDNIFSDFKQRSDIHFQKATLLIGNEIGSINDSILEFSYDFGKILRQYEQFLSDYNSLVIIEEIIKEINLHDKTQSEIDSYMIRLKEKSIVMKNEEKAIINAVNNIKESFEYKKEMKNEEELEDLKRLEKKELINLRQMVDFKALSSEFHSDSKKMKSINEYKENFSECFEKENCIGLTSLLHEAGINVFKISGKIHEILKLKEKIKEKNKKVENENFETNKIKGLEFKLRIKRIDIENLEQEYGKEQRKLDRFNENKQELIESLRQEMEKMNAGLVT